MNCLYGLISLIWFKQNKERTDKASSQSMVSLYAHMAKNPTKKEPKNDLNY